MEKKFFPFCLFLIICAALFTNGGCNKSSKYDLLVKRELSKGTRYDSLFLGYSLGMTRKQFFDHCWKLNQKHTVTQGSHGLSVEYDFDILGHTARMEFYPTFYKNKIYQMPAVVSYSGWAPWNENLKADSLQLDLKRLFEKWYGKGFIKLRDPNKGLVYFKVDGNRGISIFTSSNDQDVNVLFTDLEIDQ